MTCSAIPFLPNPRAITERGVKNGVASPQLAAVTTNPDGTPGDCERYSPKAAAHP